MISSNRNQPLQNHHSNHILIFQTSNNNKNIKNGKRQNLPSAKKVTNSYKQSQILMIPKTISKHHMLTNQFPKSSFQIHTNTKHSKIHNLSNQAHCQMQQTMCNLPTHNYSQMEKKIHRSIPATNRRSGRRIFKNSESLICG